MPTTAHFINVGQGNMTLLQLSNGKTFLYDCNITNDNEKYVLGYLRKTLGQGKKIDVFVCSHRDSDHMRGVKKVHSLFPIQTVWDSGVTGTTPDCCEYREFMDLRRSIGFKEVSAGYYFDYGNTRLRVMNSKNDNLPNDANAQSVVIKVVHRDDSINTDYDSILLTGDTNAVAWKDISRRYKAEDLSCSLLLASHHGSLTYFDDPSDRYYFLSHLEVKSPAVTILSVGPNPHGHPEAKALEFYEKHSSGSNQGNKVFRTDKHGTVCAVLKDRGGWALTKGL